MGRLSNELIPDPYVPETEVSQIGDHRLSTPCEVVERLDHHCGDDHIQFQDADNSTDKTLETKQDSFADNRL